MSTLVLHASRAARQVDRVLLFTALLALAIAVFLPPVRAMAMFEFTLENLLSIAPFLIASALAAAYLSAAGADTLIGRAFHGRHVVAISAAALFGALSPFCSCGVIPLIAALLAAGTPLPAVMAFWLASPIMDPEMFLLTAGGIGLPFATAKTLAAIGLGLLGGFATLVVQRMGGFQSPLRHAAVFGQCGGGRLPEDRHAWAFWREPARREAFNERFRWTLYFLGKWLLLAFVLEAVMVTYLPPNLVATWLGGDSVWAIPLSVLVGVPAYMNGYAAIPLVAGLMDTGMGAGPALAFMTAGAVTSIPAAIAVFALVNRPVFAWYLGLAAVGSIVAGVAYQSWVG